MPGPTQGPTAGPEAGPMLGPTAGPRVAPTAPALARFLLGGTFAYPFVVLRVFSSALSWSMKPSFGFACARAFLQSPSPS